MRTTLITLGLFVGVMAVGRLLGGDTFSIGIVSFITALIVSLGYAGKHMGIR